MEKLLRSSKHHKNHASLAQQNFPHLRYLNSWNHIYQTIYIHTYVLTVTSLDSFDLCSITAGVPQGVFGPCLYSIYKFVSLLVIMPAKDGPVLRDYTFGVQNYA